MLNKIKKDNKGFTIIEVLIVLAIAGLILLVVFLAVPALQRQSRNTQLKAAVTNVLGGLSDFSGTYDGKTPNAISTADGVVTISDGTNSLTAKVNRGLIVSKTGTAGDIVVTFGKICKTDGTDVDATKGTARNVALVYEIENQNGTTTKKCDNS